MIQLPQQKRGFEQPQIAEKQTEVEKLRQEIVEMRKQLAEKKMELRQEAPAEAPTEGKSGAEIAESAPTPAGVIASQPSIQTAPTDIDNQVKNLCELAFQKGVGEAIKAAQELNNPYVLDELHDALVDNLYDRLIGEKKIEKE